MIGFTGAVFVSTEMLTAASSLSSFCSKVSLIVMDRLFFHGVLGSCMLPTTTSSSGNWLLIFLSISTTFFECP